MENRKGITVIQASLQQLLDLQTKDLTLLQLKREAQGIPERKTRLEEKAAGAKAREKSATDSLRSCESAIKQVELDIQSMREQIVRYRNQQMDVKSNDVYRALENEIATANEKIRAAEDRELEEMERLETQRVEVAAAKVERGQADTVVAGEAKALDDRLSLIRETFADIKQEREALAARVEPEVLQRYMAQLQSKQDAVVVPIRNQSCGGCHMRLTPQHIHDAHALQKWVTCSHCGRFLYEG